MPRLKVELNQDRLRGGQRLPHRVLANTLQTIADVLELKNDSSLSIAFVSEKDIRRLNRVYRGKDKVTDILSFPVSDGEMLGELLINYEQAVRQAQEMKHSVRDEVVFLIVHGTLHLLGYDHEKPLDAKNMFSLQTKILNRLGVNPRI